LAGVSLPIAAQTRHSGSIARCAFRSRVHTAVL